jgi:hypothetical protein
MVPWPALVLGVEIGTTTLLMKMRMISDLNSLSKRMILSLRRLLALPQYATV